MPGTEKTKQIEKNWRELEALGITKKVPPGEVNTWTSALHSAPKPDGSLRVCPDYRPLNNRTILDWYPLPLLKNFTAKIKGSTVFSRVDLLKAFHQIPLDKESQRKSTVITPWGAWQFVRLPMGLRNSAQSFQRLIDHVLNGVEDIFVYMDDILVFLKTLQDHMRTLEEIFRRLEENGLAISLKKCRFGDQTIEFVV